MPEQWNLDSWWEEDLTLGSIKQNKEIIRTPEMETETASCKIELKKLKNNIELNISPEEESNIQAFLDKVPSFSWYEWSRFQKSVESCSIKIRQAPWKDVFMISLDGKNLTYLLDKKWEVYFDVESWRNSPFWIALGKAIKKEWWEEKLVWDEYKLFINWNNIPLLSNQYIKIMYPNIKAFKEIKDAFIRDWKNRGVIN